MTSVVHELAHEHDGVTVCGQNLIHHLRLQRGVSHVDRNPLHALLTFLASGTWWFRVALLKRHRLRNRTIQSNDLLA